MLSRRWPRISWGPSLFAPDNIALKHQLSRIRLHSMMAPLIPRNRGESDRRCSTTLTPQHNPRLVLANRFQIHAAILDMDGTLIDSEKAYFLTAQQALKEQGIDFTETEYFGKYAGRPTAECEAHLLADYGAKLNFQLYCQRFNSLWRAVIDSGNLPLKPGAAEIIDFLHEHHIPCALATSSDLSFVRMVFGPDLLSKFDVVVTGDDPQLTNGKPAPDIFFLAAERLKVEIEKCLIVEDSTAGLQAALECGGIAVLIPDTRPPPKELAARAAATYSSLIELQDSLRPAP